MWPPSCKDLKTTYLGDLGRGRDLIGGWTSAHILGEKALPSTFRAGRRVAVCET